MKNILVTVGIAILIVIAFNAGKRWFLKPDVEKGVKAFDFEASLADGTPFRLSDLRGKYVLLDFWGSWCKPCRESNPKLVLLYDSLKDKQFDDAEGFEIVSYAVERYESNWRSAMTEDKLSWPYQVKSLNLFDDPVIKSYNVRQIPTKFLINPEGIIIAVDPSLEEVSAFIGNL